VSRGRRFLARPTAIAGAVLVATLLVIALVQPAGDPYALDVETGLSALGAPMPPSASAPLGTDPLGRDVWARVVAGAATSLGIAGLATLLALVLGIAVGIAAGFAGGWVDTVLMRGVDLVLAFPYLLLAILLAALLRETELAGSSAPVVVTLGLAGWATIARVIRAKTRALATSEMVVAARALGAGPLAIAVRHLLPNLASLVIVVAVLGFAQNLLGESVLSYLGLGPPPPAATWGRMLQEGQAYYRTAPHLVLAPGLAILTAVLAFHLLAEGLRDTVEGRRR
jgi:peptide/nickel transport system permease protein